MLRTTTFDLQFIQIKYFLITKSMYRNYDNCNLFMLIDYIKNINSH
jgi:hypothetical protein